MKALLGSVALDIRFALRSLRRTPGFAFAVIAALALGIGANVAVFTLLHAVLLSPLPYDDPAELVFINETAPERGVIDMPLSFPDLIDLQNSNRTLSGLAGFWYTNYTFTGYGRPEKIRGSRVSASLTEVLGVEPILGRSMRPDEDVEGAPGVVLIGEGLWRRKFAGDPDILGRNITLGGQPFTIIGVMPAHFQFPEASELWTPLKLNPLGLRDDRFIGAVGRLVPGETARSVEGDLGTVVRRLSQEYPETNSDLAVRVTSLRSWIFGDEKQPVLVFYGVVCLVLLLACANVANLLLARNARRCQEIAMRASLGAGRIRIARQLITESMVLAVLGGVVGLMLGSYGRDALLALAPVDLPPYLITDTGPTVLLMIGGVVVLTGMVFGLGPAVSAVRSDLFVVLQSASLRLTDASQGARIRTSLVVIEMALALTVLIGANLMVKSAIRQKAVDPMVNTEGLASVYVTLPDANYPEPEDMIVFYRRVIQDVRAMPEILDASIVTELPTDRVSQLRSLHVEGVASPEPGQEPVYPVQFCEPHYFSTMGIPILSGRDFDDWDGGDLGPRVVIVNESFAQRYWPGANPIGKRVTSERGEVADDVWFAVVGVVGDTYNDGYGRSVLPAIFIPYGQAQFHDVFLVARANVEASSVLNPLRGVIWNIDPDVPLSLARTVEGAIATENWQIRMYSWVLGLFSLIALLLASTGVYGVMSHNVTRRAREFAVRIAVGGRPRQILAMAVRQGLFLSVAGVIVGLVLSAYGTRLLGSLLFRVAPMDLAVYGISTLAIAAIAVVAAFLPARRIARVDPMSVLSHE